MEKENEEVNSNESVIVKLASTAKDIISGDFIYNEALKIVENNFELVEEKTNKYTLSDKSVLNCLNKNRKVKLRKIKQICMLKSDDIDNVIKKEKIGDISLSGVTGGVTSMLGVVSMPLNFASSTFLYFRAVEKVALYYGYDVINNPKEVLIAEEVFKEIIGNEDNDGIIKLNNSTSNSFIGWSRSASKAKDYKELAKSNSVSLIYTKMKALSDPAAKKALKKARKKGFEKSRFKDSFKWIGEKIPKSIFPKLLLGVGLAIGAVSDASQMNKVINYANDYYKRRFEEERTKRIILYLLKKYIIWLILLIGLIIYLISR